MQDGVQGCNNTAQAVCAPLYEVVSSVMLLLFELMLHCSCILHTAADFCLALVHDLSDSKLLLQQGEALSLGDCMVQSLTNAADTLTCHEEGCSSDSR